MHQPPTFDRGEAGFTYMAVLFVVALMGITLALIATVTSQSLQRENEKQLLFVGSQFIQAIGAYYESAPPGQPKRFPAQLEDLLEDNRSLAPLHHLRKMFYDPFTSNTDWGVLRDASNGIVGIYSKSDGQPIKVANFDREFAGFTGQKHYSDWKFVYGAISPQAVADATAKVEPVVMSPPEIIPPEYVAPPSQPIKSPTPEDRKQRLCNNLHSGDLRICYNLLKTLGEAAGATCLASASRRFAACNAGEMLSPLAVQYK